MTLITLGAVLAIAIIAAIVLAIRSGSGTHYGHHGHRHR
jgi:hypothetical protein